MIKQIILSPNIKEELEEFVVKGSGKILKVRVETNQTVNIKIFTNEEEMILNVNKTGTYYPRANITAQKYTEDPLAVEGETKFDYYYFDGLLVVLETDKVFNKLSQNRKNVFGWPGFDKEEEIKPISISIIYDDLK